LYVVGSLARPHNVKALHRIFPNAVWVPSWHGDETESNRALPRLESGDVGALVLLEAFISHRPAYKWMAAARARDVPWARGGKGGKGQLHHAFEALERDFARRQQQSGAVPADADAAWTGAPATH
jgi:hypothetical protein